MGAAPDLGCLEITRKIVHNLSHEASPINRIHSPNLVLPLEVQIIRNRLDNVLAIIKHTLNRDVVNIRVLQTEHLRLLKRAHPALR